VVAGATHHGLAVETAWDGAEPWKIARISHKFHACCHGLHAMLEALGPLSVDPAKLDRLTIYSHPRWLTVCNQPEPDTGLGAKFSFRQTAAMTLKGHQTMAIGTYTDALAQDSELVALRQKVEVLADETLTEMQSRVVGAMQGGNTVKATHDLNAPMSLGDRETRLRTKVTALLGSSKSEALWAAVNSNDVNTIFQT